MQDRKKKFTVTQSFHKGCKAKLTYKGKKKKRTHNCENQLT